MKQAQWKLNSPIGSLYLVASERGLQELVFTKSKAPLVKSLKSSKGPEVEFLMQAVSELEEYFKGKRTRFDIPLDVQGTTFQMKVWNQLSKIPYGKTVSYSDVAKRIKNERAVRAVGTANGRNPVSIIVPCHRVIAADGTLGGYGGGLHKKIKLLQLEGSMNFVSE